MTTLSGGHSVGRYRIVRMLGQGAMGEVYLAEDPQIGRPLAIKTLRLAGVSYDELGERRVRLLREAKTAGRLLHPHIVTLFDAGEEGGAIYLAFEYVPGSDLSVRLVAGPPPTLGEALRFVHEACLGLDHAHRQGIVHRDIKPSNLLLDSDGRIKISDFGIAKMADQTTDLTVTGSVLGSPHYLSPEQIRGEDLDGRSDLFSLGVVLYQLLAARRPFDAETLGTLVYQILHVEPPPVATLRPELPVRLQEVVRRLLAKDRDERFATAGEVATELSRAAAEMPATLLAEPAGGTAAPGPPSGAISGTASGRPPTGGTSTNAPTLASGAWPAGAPPATWSGGSAAFPTGTGAPPAGWGGTAPPPPPPPETGRLGRAQEPAAGSGTAGGVLPAAAVKKGPPVAAIVAVAAVVLLAGAVGLFFVLRGPVQRLLGTAERPPVVASTSDGEEPSATATEPPAGPESDRATTSREPAPRTGPLDRRPNPPVTRPEAGEPSRPPGEQRPSSTPTGTAGAQRPAPGTGAPPSPPYPASSSSTAPPGTVASREPPPAGEDEVEDEPVAETAPEPAPSRPVPAVDATMKGGLGLGFRVVPPDAFVLVDGRVVGRAHEFTAATKRLHDLPGPGSYVITLRRADHKDYRVRFEADAGGPRMNAIVARLTPLAAADVALSDLELHQVREAVALRVDPPTARVLVDGRFVGAAGRFSGGAGRASGWLELTPGRHRISLVAPGHRQVDLAVEVSAGAEERRKRIRVDLPREAGG